MQIYWLCTLYQRHRLWPLCVHEPTIGRNGKVSEVVEPIGSSSYRLAAAFGSSTARALRQHVLNLRFRKGMVIDAEIAYQALIIVSTIPPCTDFKSLIGPVGHISVTSCESSPCVQPQLVKVNNTFATGLRGVSVTKANIYLIDAG